MLTANDIAVVKAFVKDLPADSHVYGCVDVYKMVNDIPERLGTYPINNNVGEQSVSYFINGDLICGHPHNLISKVELTIGESHLLIENKKK